LFRPAGDAVPGALWQDGKGSIAAEQLWDGHGPVAAPAQVCNSFWLSLPNPTSRSQQMISLATIVFKSGATVEVPFGAQEAEQLLAYFGENWDEVEPELSLPATALSSGCRIVPSEVVGIFVTNGVDDDEDEHDEDEDDDEDEDEDDDDGDEDADDTAAKSTEAA
jgi:hypothetical protein